MTRSIVVALVLGVSGCAATPKRPSAPPPPPRIEGITVLLEGRARVHANGGCAAGLTAWPRALRDGVVGALRASGFKVVLSPERRFDVAALLTAVATSCDAKGRGRGLVMLTLLHGARPAIQAEASFRVEKIRAGHFVGARVVPPTTTKLARRLVGALLTSRRCPDNPVSGTCLDVLATKLARRAPTATRRPSPADQRPIVAVFGVEDAQRAAEITRQGTERPPAAGAILNSDELTDYLTARLAETGSFRLVPQPRLRRALKQQKLRSYRDCYDRACQIELGKALAAQKTLATRVLTVGDRCVTSAILYDLSSETTDSARSVSGACHRAALMQAVERIARDLR